MTAQIIDGKKIAEQVRADVAAQVKTMSERGVVPGLAVVLIGEDPASAVYVRNKMRSTIEAGMRSFDHKLPVETTESDLLALVQKLNHDPAVHGILVQMPLPKHIDSSKVINAIDPAKDVDGFHPVNAGLLASGGDGFVPCTPLGSMILIGSVEKNIAGMQAVVLGRSNIVGKPMAHLLLKADCTVTVAHSKTRDLPDVCRNADILIAAVGRPEMVRGDWIKPGAIVIDVGINRITDPGTGKARLAGDVAYDEAREQAGAITPVPGGVGPMTIACLLRNTLQAASRLA